MTAPFRGLIWQTAEEHEEPRLRRPAIYVLLASAVSILGFNWPMMAIALRELTPIWMAAIRVLGATVVALLIGLARRNFVRPPRNDLPMIFSVAVFRLSSVMVLVFFALQLVPIGRSSVLVWTTPLWTVPIAALFLRERTSGRKWLGLTVGLSGVLIISEVWGNDWRNTGVAVGTGLLLLAAIVSASTAVHIRRHEWTIEPMQALPWQLAIGAVLLVTMGLAVDGVPQVEWTAQLIWIMAYQSVLASGLAFWAQIVVLRNLSAVSTNLTMSGVPVLGVVSSALVLGEPIPLSLASGLALVIGGVTINLLSDREDATGA